MPYWTRMVLVALGLGIYTWTLFQPGAVSSDGEAIEGVAVLLIGWLGIFNPGIAMAWFGIWAYLYSLVAFLLRVDKVAMMVSGAALMLPVIGANLTRFLEWPADESGANYTHLAYFLPAFWLSLLGPGLIFGGAAEALRRPHREPGERVVVAGAMGRYRYSLLYGLSYGLGLGSTVLGFVAADWLPGESLIWVLGGLFGAHAVATAVLLVFVYRLWLHLPTEHRAYSPGTVTGLMAVPLVNLWWQFIALPKWVEGLRAAQGREAGNGQSDSLLNLAYLTCGLWVATWVPFIGPLAAAGAVVAQTLFIDRSARAVNANA